MATPVSRAHPTAEIREVAAAAVLRSLAGYHLIDLAENHRGHWIVLSGNETGAWVTHELVLPEKPIIWGPTEPDAALREAYLIGGDYYDTRGGQTILGAVENFRARVA